jgi:hypothetical protein
MIRRLPSAIAEGLCAPECGFGLYCERGPGAYFQDEWRRCIRWIAFNQNSVEPFGSDNISTLLSRLCLGSGSFFDLPLPTGATVFHRIYILCNDA